MSYKTKLLSTYFISVSIVIYLIYILLSTLQHTNIENVSENNFERKALERQRYIHNFFNPYLETIKALGDDKNFKNYLSGDLDQTIIENYFLSVKNSLSSLTQVRYLDLKGNEIIRIDGTPLSISKKNSISKIVDKKDLQKKYQRTYIKKFLKLKKDEVGISKINLNKEHGKITLPKEPTIRLGILTYDNNMVKKGILIFNIHLEQLAKELDNSSLYNMHIIDNNGVFLYHHESKKYGLLGENMNHNIFDEFPKFAKDILKNDTFTNENLYSKKIEDFDNDQSLKIILVHKFQIQVNNSIFAQNFFVISSIIIAVVLLYITIYVSKIPDLLKTQLRNKKEIENKNKFIDTLLQSIPIALFYKDLDGKYFDINQTYTDITGLSKDQIVGNDVYDVYDKELADFYTKKDQELIKSDLTKKITYEGIFTNVKTNETLNMIFYKTLFFDVKNKPKGIIGAAIDITELKQTQNKLELLNKNLADKVTQEVALNMKKEVQLFESNKLASMGSMIGHIIHQWKQPLNIISLTSSILRMKADRQKTIPNSEVTDELDSIDNSIDRLVEVTNTFRDFLKEKKEFKTIILQDTIKNALTISGTVLNDKSIELEKELNEKEPLKITTIPNELIEILINIINNAIDAIEEKNIEDGIVKISIYKEKNNAIITIEDNGGGIPKHILPNIFNEYFTTKSESKGTGLGLYMSHKILKDSLKGDIYVKNTKVGAKFFIELPI